MDLNLWWNTDISQLLNIRRSSVLFPWKNLIPKYQKRALTLWEWKSSVFTRGSQPPFRQLRRTDVWTLSNETLYPRFCRRLKQQVRSVWVWVRQTNSGRAADNMWLLLEERGLMLTTSGAAMCRAEWNLSDSSTKTDWCEIRDTENKKQKKNKPSRLEDCHVQHVMKNTWKLFPLKGLALSPGPFSHNQICIYKKLRFQASIKENQWMEQ